MRELEPLRIKLQEGSTIVSINQMVGDTIRKMPPGMMNKDNIINWMPGVGFNGNYQFVAVVKDIRGNFSKKLFSITIEPKYSIIK